MGNAPNLRRQPRGPDFYNHGEILVSYILDMADRPENLKEENKTTLLPEMTTSILEKAYKEDGCTDEIKVFAFKQFVRNYLKTEGWKGLETIFNKIIEQDEPVSGRIYLSDIYKKLKAEFEEQFVVKSFTGKKVEDTVAGTRVKLGYAQVDPKQDIGGRGANPWPMRK